MRSISVGARRIGDGAPCFVIAEAGSNHDGDLEQAYRLIDVAAAAGADAVKFQIFRADRLYPRSAGRSGYLGLQRSIYDVIAEMETPYEWLPLLAGRCRERGVAFMASAFDEESLDRLDPFVECHKVASYELTHLPFVRHVAATGKPVVVSTGTASLAEVAGTVAAFRASGNEQLALLQCTAAYPAPLESLNVRALETLRRAFGVPTGLSDHSRDPLVGPLTAVAAGAAIVEKHLTLSNDLPGPDHAFALEPHELALMVEKLRQAELALGSGAKEVEPVEAELRAFARRSIFAVCPVARGERFTRDNVAVLRNGENAPGLAPDRLGEVLGASAARDVAPDRALTEADVSLKRPASTPINAA